VNTIAGLVLLLLFIVVFQNYAAGTLGQWFKAKFFNQAD
jgi:hypothetical protein